MAEQWRLWIDRADDEDYYEAEAAYDTSSLRHDRDCLQLDGLAPSESAGGIPKKVHTLEACAINQTKKWLVRPDAAGKVARSQGVDREMVRSKLMSHVQNVLTDEQPLR